MFRRCVVVVGALYLAFSATESASAWVAYTVTDLGQGIAYGINAGGQVVGRGSGGCAFLYTDGAMTSLGGGCSQGYCAIMGNLI